MLIPLNITCLKCKKTNKKLVKMYDPASFSTGGTKTILHQSWCQFCEEPIVVRYTFIREGEEIQAIVKHRLKAESVFVPQEPEMGITIKPKRKTK